MLIPNDRLLADNLKGRKSVTQYHPVPPAEMSREQLVDRLKVIQVSLPINPEVVGDLYTWEVITETLIRLAKQLPEEGDGK